MLRSPLKPTPKKATPSKPPATTLPAFLCPAPPVFHQQPVSVAESYFEDNSQLLEQDLARCEQVLRSYIAAEKETSMRVQQLREFTIRKGVGFDSGMGFYSCKNMLFNEYLACLKFYQLFRLNHGDFTVGPGLRLYQRLVYLKTLILKLGPAEKKLEYQKNKLLKKGEKVKINGFKQRAAGEQGDERASSSQSEQQQENNNEEANNEQDDLAYRPMVQSLLADKVAKKPPTDKYIAPKQSSVLPAEEKAKRREQRQKQRRKAFLVRKFRGDIEQGDDAEQKRLLDDVDQKVRRRFEEKQEFEINNFTRLSETKKEKYWKKQMLKNKFNNTMNEEIDELKLLGELVKEDAKPMREYKSELPKQKPTKKRKPQ